MQCNNKIQNTQQDTAGLDTFKDKIISPIECVFFSTQKWLICLTIYIQGET